MKDIGKLFIALTIGLVVGYFFIPREKEVIRETVTVEIEVPAQVGSFDPVEDPEPVTITNTEYVVDTELVDKYKKANDSLKAELFKSAVTERDYKQIFEDSVQTITVKTNVTGKLNSIAADYYIKPFTVKKDTVIEFKIPANKRSLSLYTEIGVPTKLPTFTEQNIRNGVIFKAGVDVKNKKGWIFGGSYDTNETVWGKIGKSFKF